MKFAKTLVAMVLALAMVLTMSSVAMAEDAGTIKIGLIGPMTGAAASYGTSVRQGAELAVEEVNGLGGVQIEPVSYTHLATALTVRSPRRKSAHACRMRACVSACEGDAPSSAMNSR